jgi:hypothetical protein
MGIIKDNKWPIQYKKLQFMNPNVTKFDYQIKSEDEKNTQDK